MNNFGWPCLYVCVNEYVWIPHTQPRKYNFHSFKIVSDELLQGNNDDVDVDDDTKTYDVKLCAKSEQII